MSARCSLPPQGLPSGRDAWLLLPAEGAADACDCDGDDGEHGEWDDTVTEHVSRDDGSAMTLSVCRAGYQPFASRCYVLPGHGLACFRGIVRRLQAGRL